MVKMKASLTLQDDHCETPLQRALKQRTLSVEQLWSLHPTFTEKGFVLRDICCTAMTHKDLLLLFSANLRNTSEV